MIWYDNRHTGAAEPAFLSEQRMIPASPLSPELCHKNCSETSNMRNQTSPKSLRTCTLWSMYLSMKANFPHPSQPNCFSHGVNHRHWLVLSFNVSYYLLYLLWACKLDLSQCLLPLQAFNSRERQKTLVRSMSITCLLNSHTARATMLTLLATQPSNTSIIRKRPHGMQRLR